MQAVAYEEIKNIAEYEIERETWRPRVLAIKEARRVRVGGHLTFLFENRETVRYQVQEMMRIERIVKERDVRYELETYNELIPGPGELSTSLLIEYDSPEERSVWLSALLGLENHVWVQIGNHPPARARFDTRQIATDRISSVQYIKFPTGEAALKSVRDGVRLYVDHPKYNESTTLSAAQVEALAADRGV
ncbi:MAG: DUF3501 family protein [Acidobacteria bacterium]|nr:DUF3501 family protein [Acidobacteriota bacterium]